MPNESEIGELTELLEGIVMLVKVNHFGYTLVRGQLQGLAPWRSELFPPGLSIKNLEHGIAIISELVVNGQVSLQRSIRLAQEVENLLIAEASKPIECVRLADPALESEL